MNGIRQCIGVEVNMGSIQARKKQLRRRIIGFFLFLAVLIIAALLVFFLPTSKKMDAAVYFQNKMSEAGASGEDALLEEDGLAVVLEDYVDARKALRRDEKIYFNYDMVREKITTRFYLDEEESRMLYTMPDETWEIPENCSYYLTKAGKVECGSTLAFRENGTWYLSAELLAGKINLEYIEGEEGKHILVHYRWEETRMAVVKKNTKLRVRGHRKGLVLTALQEGSMIRVLSEEGKWSMAVSEDGFIGYLPSSCMETPQDILLQRDFEADVYESLQLDEKLNLIWHQTGNLDSNSFLKQDAADVTGANVISPTWFFMSDNEGSFESLAQKSYVTQAHKMGMQVWGLVSNFSADVSSAQVFASTKARNKLAEGLIKEAKKCGIDGINVDFEYITEESGYGYVQFVRELSVLCRQEGLILSVDVPVPMSFNRQYDRGELGVYCDYVIIMGYDEHYVGSAAGSVASITFEEEGIKEMLRLVPANKVVSGVPFYSRIWKTMPDASAPDGVSSRLIGMNGADEEIEANKAEKQWDDETAQYYASWTDPEDDGLCEIWMEEEESVRRKAELVSKYSLGGIAEWALGFERSSIWDVISQAIEE